MSGPRETTSDPRTFPDAPLDEPRQLEQLAGDDHDCKGDRCPC